MGKDAPVSLYAFSDSVFSSKTDHLLYAGPLAHSSPSRTNNYLTITPSNTGRYLSSMEFTGLDFETIPSLFQRSYLPTSQSTTFEKRHLIVSSPRRDRINYKRASVIGMTNAGAIFFGFKHSMSLWGKSNGRFHVKDDWKGDHLAQTDELSHFMWGYRMTQFLFSAYHWMGLSSKTSGILSMSESALILTSVEFPIDAYNPQQGLGISDLIFDYLGVGLAFTKEHVSWLEDFDFRISWKKNIFSSHHPGFAETYQEYDNFIYWLTYRTKLFLPRKIICLGFGYGATHHGIEPERRFYWGIGLSLSDFTSLFWDKLEKRSKFLDLFYPNLRVEL
jgi:hypothetical protein